MKDSGTRAVIFDRAALSAFDGPGARTVVFFQGCRAGCPWCHSPHSQPPRSPLLFAAGSCAACGRCADACPNRVHRFSGGIHSLDRAACTGCGRCVEACPLSSLSRKGGVLSLPTRSFSVGELFEQLAPSLAVSDGITLSGGEALLQPDAAIELLKLCKRRGIHTAVETSGLLPLDVYAAAAPYTDAWLFGLRVLTRPRGRFHTDALMSALDVIKAFPGCAIFPRVPMIPGVMDGDDALGQMLRLLEYAGADGLWLNRWNRFFGHYYELCGLAPDFPAPSEMEIERCESKMRSFFAQKGMKIAPK